jgi:hypothetical protein
MSDRISLHTVLTAPGPNSAVAGVDPDADPALNYRFNRASLLRMLGGIDQNIVAASTTLALTAAHLGNTIVLRGAGSAITANATTLGAGYAVRLKNWHTAAWTVAGISNATLYFFDPTHTKISPRGSASVEFITVDATMYAMIDGETEA